MTLTFEITTANAENRTVTTYQTRNRLTKFLGKKTKIKEVISDGEALPCVTTYHSNGQVFEKGHQDAQGAWHGEFTQQDEFGNRYTAHYDHGVLHEHFRLEDVSFVSGHYQAGKKIGIWQNKDKDGRLKSKAFYKNDGSEVGFEFHYDADQNFKSFCLLKDNAAFYPKENKWRISLNALQFLMFKPASSDAFEIEKSRIETIEKTADPKLIYKQVEDHLTKELGNEAAKLSAKFEANMKDIRIREEQEILNVSEKFLEEQREQLAKSNGIMQKVSVANDQVLRLASIEPLTP